MVRKKSQDLEDLAKEYVTWQQRLDALEAERPGVHARFMEQQQAAMDGQGTPEAIQEAREGLQILDEQIEACLNKVETLWLEGEQIIEADIAARKAAEPKSRASLAQEHREKCARAATLFVQALAITDDLNLDRAAVSKFLGLPENHTIFGYCAGLQEAIDEARRQLPPPGVTYRQKVSELDLFLNSSSGINLPSYILQTFNRAVLAQGGRRAIISLGAGDLAHQPSERSKTCPKFSK
jgi:hypothetical protein